MNKTLKIFAILMIAIMLISVSTSVFASDTTKKSILDEVSINNDVKGQDDIKKIASTVMSYITVIGMVICAIVIGFLGIKYMIGSPEQKSDYKKSFMPLIVGAILTFGALTIAKIITSFTF